MALAQVKYCILCEDIHPEGYGRSTILGYYGLTPDVKMLIKEPDLPVTLRRITFFLILGEGEVKGTMSVSLQDEQGQPVIERSGVPVDIAAPPGKTTNIVLGPIHNMQFPQYGKFTLVVKLDGAKFYETSFKVERGQPEDFR